MITTLDAFLGWTGLRESLTDCLRLPTEPFQHIGSFLQLYCHFLTILHILRKCFVQFVPLVGLVLTLDVPYPEHGSVECFVKLQLDPPVVSSKLLTIFSNQGSRFE